MAAKPDAPEEDFAQKEKDLSSFMTEVKHIEVRDSVWTSDTQIKRLLRPGHRYFNMNPFEVFQLPPDANDEVIKKQYRKLSILIHPDKNPNNPLAQDAFTVVNEANKTLQDPEKKLVLMNIVADAKERLEEELSQKRKKLKKETGLAEVKIEEDDKEVYTRQLNTLTCKVFAEIDQRKQNAAKKEQIERKRQREMEIEAEESFKKRQDDKKAWEETRDVRVDAWRSFQQAAPEKKKKTQHKLGTYRPPTLKVEQRTEPYKPKTVD